MALIIVTGGTTGAKDGTLVSVSNPVTFSALNAVVTLHMRSDGLGTDDLDVTLPSEVQASVDNSTWYTLSNLPLQTVNQVNVPLYLKQTSLASAQAGSFTTSAVFDLSAADITAPTQPAGLVATANSSTQVTLSGATSSDNVGIAKWQYKVDSGAWVDITSSASNSLPSTPVTGLTASTTYTFYVRTLDAAGNPSTASAGVQAATQTALQLIDSFEGTNGSAVPNWTSTASNGFKCDTSVYKVGSASGKHSSTSAWVVSYRDLSALTLNTNNSELQFWYRAGATVTGTTERIVETSAEVAWADTQQFQLMMDVLGGNVAVWTNRTGVTGYSTTAANVLAAISPNTWYQFRVVFDFTAHTYQLSWRTDSANPWTQLKTTTAPDYNIPFYGTTNTTAVNTIRILTGTGTTTQTTDTWLDDLRYLKA
jgi:hypothetical protein